MAGTLCIRSDRLCLRPLASADAPRLRDIAGVPDVARMMSSVEYPWKLAQVENWIENAVWRGNLPFRLGIFTSTGDLLGTLGIGPERDIAYFIGVDHWQKGYATEALSVFLSWLFLSFDIDDVSAEHLDDNPASGAVLRKLGFDKVGQSTCQSKARVEAEPSTLYRLTRDTFEGRHEIS